MSRTINSVAILGSGTMGAGIAALCAKAGVPVLLLDMTRDPAAKALEAMTSGARPLIETKDQAALVTTGSFDEDLGAIGKCDWICEAIIEDLAAKRALLTRVEEHRRPGSIVSTNTSGIPLRAITRDMPPALCRDIAVTHFFNPVKFMRLLELVPSADAKPDVITELAQFCRNRLGKGIVHAKDTVNFIGNRAFSDSDLRDEITTSESNWWDAITAKGRSYDPDKLNFDRELLRRFYLKNGYADFRVVSAVAEIDREQQNFLITFTVDEGEKDNFGEIEIDSSLSTLPLELVEQGILTQSGETYDASKVEKSVENIVLEAGKVGFAFIQVRPRPQRNPDTRTIDLTYQIDDGPRVYVERINIYGNIRTRDEVIRRE